MKSIIVKHPLRGPADACPLHISLHFTSQQLQKITLAEGEDLALFFEDHPAKRALIEWFEGFFLGKPSSFPLPLYRGDLTPFTRQVLEQLQKIPRGQTLSYADVAANVGNEKSARAVGNICRDNPFPLLIPCHRVIRRDGSLGGFAYGLKMKQMLLNMERLETL